MPLQALRWSVLVGGLFVLVAFAFDAAVPTLSTPARIETALVQQVRISDRLYFGRQHPGGIVTESEWAAFLAGVVTPRFPQGLTVWAASGQWRDSADRVNREPTFVLEIVHTPDRAADAALKSVVAEYRQRFAQESVLWVRDQVNVVD